MINMRITKVEFKNIITGKNSPTVVSFGAAWSGNSEMLFNILEDIENELYHNVDFCLIDIEENPDFANQWGIQEIPTTLIIQKNEVVDFFTGLISRARIKQKIKTYL